MAFAGTVATDGSGLAFSGSMAIMVTFEALTEVKVRSIFLNFGVAGAVDEEAV